MDLLVRVQLNPALTTSEITLLSLLGKNDIKVKYLRKIKKGNSSELCNSTSGPPEPTRTHTKTGKRPVSLATAPHIGQ